MDPQALDWDVTKSVDSSLKVLRDRVDGLGVTQPVVVKQGAGHGWPDWFKDMATIADWFDAHLKPKKESAAEDRPSPNK